MLSKKKLEQQPDPKIAELNATALGLEVRTRKLKQGENFWNGSKKLGNLDKKRLWRKTIHNYKLLY